MPDTITTTTEVPGARELQVTAPPEPVALPSAGADAEAADQRSDRHRSTAGKPMSTHPRPAAPTHASALLPATRVDDAALYWLEATIDARLHATRRHERLRRTASALLATTAATGLGLWIGGLL